MDDCTKCAENVSLGTKALLHTETMRVALCKRTGLVNICTHDQSVCIRGICIDLRTQEGTFRTGESSKCLYSVTESNKSSSQVVYTFENGPALCLRLESVWGGKGLSCKVNLTNSSSHTFHVDRISVFSLDSSSQVLLHGTQDFKYCYRNGYQSWHEARFEEMRNEGESWWVACLIKEDSDTTLTLGFVTTDDYFGRFDWTANHGKIETLNCWNECDGVPLESGEEMDSEELYLLLRQGLNEQLETYADTVGSKMHARLGDDVATGWCSWYYYYPTVTQDDILSNVEALSKSTIAKQMQYIQIDAGWNAPSMNEPDWEPWGDWEPGYKYSSGMKYVADRIKEKGFSAGIWLAPFAVDHRSGLYRKHPDWVVTDGQIPAVTPYSGRYGLDLTNPEVQDWLMDLFLRVVEDWGFDYVKLDFLDVGAIKGKRYDKKATGAEAYRKGLETIRAAVGDNRFILACGAPLGPAVGLVDGMRVGPDVSAFWRLNVDIGFENLSIYAVARNAIGRFFLNNKIWQNDPDCLVVRDEYGPFDPTILELTNNDASVLSQNEAELWTSVVGLSGGMMLLSEDASRLPEERWSLIKRVLPVYSQTPRIVPDFSDSEVRGMFTHIQKPSVSWTVLGVFNFSEEPKNMNIRLESLQLDPAKKYYCYHFWTDDCELISDAVYSVDVEKHTADLIRITEVKDIPQIVATDAHVTIGGVDIIDEIYCECNHILSCSLSHPLERVIRIMVFMPFAFYFADVEWGKLQEHRDYSMGSLLTFETRLSDNGNSKIDMKFKRRI